MSASPSFSGGPAEVPDDARLSTLLEKANLLVLSDAEAAEETLREAHALARQLGDTVREALALTLLGATFYFRSQYHTALDFLNKAQAVADLTQDGAIQSRVANNMGNCALAMGNYGTAVEYYQRSLDIAQAYGDDAGRAAALSNMALIHVDLGSYDLALETFQEVMLLTRQAGTAHSIALSSSTINLVMSYYHVGRLEEALALARTHLPVVQALGIRQHEVVLRVWTLPCLTGTGQAAETVREAEALLPLAEQVRDHEQLVALRIFYAQALMHLGRLDDAETQLSWALKEAQAHGIRSQERSVLQELCGVYAARQAWQQAYEFLQAYEELDRVLHAEAVERKAQVLGVQMQMEVLRRTAETERRRSAELTEANVALQAAQQALAHRATHDALTGLANRAHFQAEVERALQSAADPFALLFIDLDRFKHVNDTLGHDVGDDLLRAVAGQLREAVRSDDLVARMGGDEFTVILRALHHPEDAERVAHKILNRLARPVCLGEHTVHVTASIGVAVAPRDGTDVTTLQKHADIAMYRAKHEGKNGVRTFAPAPEAHTSEQDLLERELRDALHLHQFVLHYQGQVDADRNLQGFEALVRWRHPTLGLLPPARFLQAAEDSHLILPLGEWVLREACRQARAWQTHVPDLSISVNISAAQFGHAGFVRTVQAALQASGLDPRCLILELGEAGTLKRAEAPQRLAHLEALGVRVALEGFGGGQSSLSLLHTLPINLLKIDRSFVAAVTDQEADQMILDLTITLAHHLKLPVTAEGVETPRQLALLTTLGCDTLQGFLLSRPLPPEDVEALLVSGKNGAAPAPS